MPGRLLMVCLMVMFASVLKAQATKNTYPQNYFKAPLDIPLALAGNFGEPRAGHFHAGLDFQTKQQEGLPVYAAADGYVSRINVSPVGYGNALYITHPNGYVTVYGHLKEFSPALMSRLRKEQYAKKAFALNIQLSPGEFIIKQGDKIATSGSTGSSGGPHLHFEIRDSSEFPVNPLLFGVKIADATPPVVSFLKFFPMDQLKYNCDGYLCKLSLKGNQYQPPAEVIKLNSTAVGVAVNTYDLMDKVENTLGIYNLKLTVDGKLIYEYETDRMSFKDGRYVLSQIDYPRFLNEDEQIYHKCFVEPGNKCPVYSNLVNRGIIDLSDKAIHDVKIDVADFSNNVSSIHFKVQYDEKSSLLKIKESPYVKEFIYSEPNEFLTNEFKMRLPANCLFDTLHFNYSMALSTSADVYSKDHLLSPAGTGFFDWYYLSIKTDKLLPRYNEKAVVVFKDEKGNEFSRGGTYKDGFVSTRAREFGLCYIKIDTVPPVIHAINIAQDKNIRKSKTIAFKISDDLSGIAAYNTYLDDSWVVSDYDAKSGKLVYKVEADLKAGDHVFKVVVEDERQNHAEQVVRFVM